MARYLTVKEAALALGVHPQTVRAWTTRGLLHAIRLPGSRYRRYAEDEIHRMKKTMGAPATWDSVFTALDPLWELAGAFDSGSSDTVDRLHEEVAEAIEEHRSRTHSRDRVESGRRAGARKRG
jgi:excisionase family DNA binding protein